MIKWLKKLVKGSDFVVTKKKISVIALDPRAGKSYGEDIAGLFSDVVDISVFSMLDGSAAGVLERADLFVASTDAYGPRRSWPSTSRWTARPWRSRHPSGGANCGS